MNKIEEQLKELSESEELETGLIITANKNSTVGMFIKGDNVTLLALLVSSLQNLDKENKDKLVKLFEKTIKMIQIMEQYDVTKADELEELSEEDKHTILSVLNDEDKPTLNGITF